MKTAAILVARLQTPFVDESLRKLINSLRTKYDKTGVAIGKNKTGPTKINPLDVSLRRQMLTTAFPDVLLFDIEDHPSDKKWSSKLDESVSLMFTGCQITLYGSDEGFVEKYSGQYEVVSTGARHKLPDSPDEEAITNSENFRRGVVYGLSRTYDKVFPTVDVAVFRHNRSQILLGMKDIDKRWRFPGGFTDPGDESFESAARRELQEECGLSDISPLAYEASFRVDDWRYRHENDKIITTLFSTELITGAAKASDDIEEVRWFSSQELRHVFESGETAPEHTPHFRHLLQKYF